MKLEGRNFLPEFKFRTSRSSGAGGQHVNKTETKVELIFDIAGSSLLSEAEKARLTSKLASYINADGKLRLNNAASRSQSANKEAVIEKFYQLLEKGLKKEKKRIPTKMPKEIKQEILKSKKLHSQKKAERRFNKSDLL